MPQQPRSRPTAPAATVVLLVGALASATVAGCGSSQPAAGPDTSDPTVTTVVHDTDPPDPQSVEQAVLAAYQRFWQVWLAANNPPNPEHPGLAEVATGVELETIRRSIAEKVANGTFTRLPDNSRYRHDATFLGITDGVASVLDCAFDDGEVVSASTGQIFNDEVATQEILGGLTQADDVWRVDSIRIQRQQPGEIECRDF